jgi:hypothetical protein
VFGVKGEMMSKIIFKYPIPEPSASFRMPVGTRILCCLEQNGNPCIWVEIDKLIEKIETRHFQVIPTGMQFEGGEYIGTVKIDAFIFHVYEVKR